ncbi:MAG: ethanolamine utilization microcompartment protein EutL [Synergistaceae bacterium]|jgi:ethanolamine utilization protein EutL|nr:ethanolamine utilization microcompartment protein EutL [Synergistaceae bacterium]
MKGDKIFAKILSAQIITSVSSALAKEYGLNETEKSVGIFTSDNDDIGFLAMDDATKKANVRVAYGGSMYAGGANANTLLAGELFAVVAGPDVSEVKAGMQAVFDFFDNGIHFVCCNEDNNIFYLAYTVSRVGTYFSSEYGIKPGNAMAYCVAPPLESVFAADAALKAANVEIAAYWKPPTNTNFGGVLFTGAQSDCVSACSAYGGAVQSVADEHIRLG